ncbi:unnamed protein product [Sphagnum jensenii]|uniref:Uncharacterized protein n=1 Tax=Sphagnum jensenii TaxID=128206 RepID=A0ABP0VCE3_9BRYO
MNLHHHRVNPAVISYRNMRRWVGWLAILLPVLTAGGYMVFGAHRFLLLDSISEYYYTMMRDVFVGTLCMVGLFLIGYRGYDDWEDFVFNLAAVLAILIAFFSMDPEPGRPCDINFDTSGACYDTVQLCNDCSPSFALLFQHKLTILHLVFYHYIHFTCAGLLFIILGYVSCCLFTRTARHRDPGTTEMPTPEKLRRNIIYRTLGIIIWVSISFYGVYSIINGKWPELGFCRWLTAHHVLFFVEWISLWSFGFSWLIKGEGVWFLNDAPVRVS